MVSLIQCKIVYKDLPLIEISHCNSFLHALGIEVAIQCVEGTRALLWVYYNCVPLNLHDCNCIVLALKVLLIIHFMMYCMNTFWGPESLVLKVSLRGL